MIAAFSVKHPLGAGIGANFLAADGEPFQDLCP